MQGQPEVWEDEEEEVGVPCVVRGSGYSAKELSHFF